jgi:hypothetical protein
MLSRSFKGCTCKTLSVSKYQVCVCNEVIPIGTWTVSGEDITLGFPRPPPPFVYANAFAASRTPSLINNDTNSTWLYVSASRVGIGLETPTPKRVQGSALSIHHSHPIALTGPSRRQLPLAITTMRLGLGSVLAPVSAKLAGISAVSTEAGRVSSALAPAPRLCRAHTSASSLPDLKNTGIIRLGRTSVVVSPHNVPHHPPTSQPSGLIVQVRSTQRRRRRMETREISLGSSEHTVRITACVFKIPLVQ